MGEVSKLAGDYTLGDLADYLVSRAADRRLGDRFVMRQPLVRGYSSLLKNFEDKYLLVCATDQLLQGTFVHVVGLSPKLLTVGVFNRAISDMGGDNQPWKFVYYKRFVATQEELFYFTYWTGRLVEGVDDAEQDEAEAKLNKACGAIDARLKEKGLLEEWPAILEDQHPAGDLSHCDDCWVRYGRRKEGGVIRRANTRGR